jgi:hypothetical protein
MEGGKKDQEDPDPDRLRILGGFPDPDPDMVVLASASAPASISVPVSTSDVILPSGAVDVDEKWDPSWLLLWSFDFNDSTG